VKSKHVCNGIGSSAAVTWKREAFNKTINSKIGCMLMAQSMDCQQRKIGGSCRESMRPTATSGGNWEGVALYTETSSGCCKGAYSSYVGCFTSRYSQEQADLQAFDRVYTTLIRKRASIRKPADWARYRPRYVCTEYRFGNVDLAWNVTDFTGNSLISLFVGTQVKA
jgi:hypothetical protein